MLAAIKIIRQIESYLDAEVEKKHAYDYRIALKVNMQINVFILVDKVGYINLNGFKKFSSVVFTEITKLDADNDPFYGSIFTKETRQNKIDFGLRRRLTGVIQANTKIEFREPCPIITFYSYKGGMGRSTALASFAAHCATHFKKKVIILDCDFEAPGFSNYFNLSEEVLCRKNGVVEYLLDRQFLQDRIDINDYLVEVSKDYAGDGQILIMQAGNLSDLPVDSANSNDIHRNHFLEGLARIDISGTDTMVDQFMTLFQEVKDSINPDIILIDSRTGFNDIFGLLSFHLSSIVVGFFGNNAQTTPGLHFFIDAIASRKIPMVLVNSIISSGKMFENFVTDINSYVESSFSEKDDLPSFQIFPLYRDPILEKVGTKDEYKSDYLNLIKNQSYSYYKDLFNGIIKTILDKKQLEKENSITPPVVHDVENIPPVKANDVIAIKGRKLTHRQCIGFKKQILNTLRLEAPNLYAKLDSLDEDSLNKKFYFRKCMEDIFNKELYIIIGNKGTGKTFLYNALKQKTFINRLKQRARRTRDNFTFIDIISVKDDPHPTKMLQVSANFKVSDLPDSDFFFNRFWLVYVWNSIMQSNELNFISKLAPMKISNNSEAVMFFSEFINSDQKMLMIEKELKELDEHLAKNQRQLVIMFDELDYVVKPIFWDKGIAPLINYWRNNPYSRIHPKLFVRSDLFEKVGNINNKQDLKKQALSIEWNQEELFAFFFKIIFANSKSEFYNLMYDYEDFDQALITEIKEASGADNQVPLKSEYLKPLVETFFGKWADRRKVKSSVYGESYDWFYRNLKNADNTISLRPFLDLINKAIEHYFNNISHENSAKPILSSYYYADAKSRAIAVENHFKDLATEEGNRDLEKVFEYIRLEAPLPLRKQTLFKREFETLLMAIIKKYGDSLDNRTTDSLRDFLIVNGVISIQMMPGGLTRYNFALLYKYYLGLTNKRISDN